MTFKQFERNLIEAYKIEERRAKLNTRSIAKSSLFLLIILD